MTEKKEQIPEITSVEGSNKPFDALKATARKYWLAGCNVVLLKGKEPLHKWSQWQYERQNELNFQALPWNEADGFALIMGQQLYNGFYIGAVDFDVKNLPMEIVEKGRQALKFLPATQREQTPSGGEHWIYHCHSKPTSISAYHNESALEILGEGKLCIMAPSQGYIKLNDNTPTEIEDLEGLFYSALEKAGVKVEKSSEAKAWFDQPSLAKQSYRGKDPPCIQALLRGTKEGLRNEYGIRLASYFINFKQYQPKTVRDDILKNWNRLNTPQLSWKEVDDIIKSAIQGHYVYGCTDPILKSQCNHDKCPIAPKQKAKLLTREEMERAERLLADPKLLEYVIQLGRRKLIGEDNILLTNFVVIASGQTKYPISSILSGFSGSGKNESIRAIKPLIPNEWLFEFTVSTPEAVKYVPEEFSGTLVIYEIAGMESKTGTLGLRSVGEGESIETIFPMRDEETGKMMLGRHKTNAKNFLTTESDIGIHADLYRRVLKLSLNHSDVLTRRVLAKKLRDAMFPESLRKKLGLDVGAKIPYSEKDFQNALRLLDWDLEVVVFPPASLMQLEKLAIKKEQKVALRSQIERILNFIRVLAIIHQRQRTIIEDKEDGSKFVIANIEDFEKAMRILAPSIIETISRLEKRQTEALELLENRQEQLWDKNKLAEELGVSTRTAARILKTLANQGYLNEIQTTKPYSYTLAEAGEKPKQLALLENINGYRAFYEKELKAFLTRIVTTCHPLHVKRGPLETLTKPIDARLNKDMEKNSALSCPDWQVVQMPTEQVPSLFTQNSLELLANSERARGNRFSEKQEDWIVKREENKVYSRDGSILFECPFCTKQGAPMFFASQADLSRHIGAFHGGYPDKPDYVR